MSVNPVLHEGEFPVPVAMDERFVLVVQHVSFSVQSGKYVLCVSVDRGFGK